MISGYIITYNDEKTIRKSLNSFYGLCDEIIVCAEVKTTDKTIEIIKEEAKAHPIKIYDYEMKTKERPHGDWSHARNFALDKCSGDWIITVDADEWFDEKSKEAIKNLLTMDCDVWEVIQYSYLDNGDSLLCPAIRIFKKGIKYNLPTHESLVDSIIEKGYRIGKSNVIMYHTGYLGDTSKKIKRNYAILKEDHPLYDYYTGALKMKDGKGKEELLRAVNGTNNKGLRAYIYCLLSQIYLKEGNIYKAITCANLSVTEEPEQNLAYKILSEIYLRIGLIDNVLTNLQIILERNKTLRCRMFNDRYFQLNKIQDDLNKYLQFKQETFKEINQN